MRRGLAACDKNICELRERAPPTPFDTIEYWGIAVLRALFTSLAANRSLRAVAERSSLGRKLSSRFVAGTQPDDVLRATQIVNQSGICVSIDDLGENVSTTEKLAPAHSSIISCWTKSRLAGWTPTSALS